MRNWPEQYVGRPYSEHNCAELAVLVQREQFGRHIELPTEMPSFFGHQAKMIDLCKADYARPVESPIEGDAVLMKCRGRFSHVGVYCVIRAQGYVLHALKSSGQVVLHRLRDLERIGLTLEGFYRWI
jgi:hypothetical protein